MNSLETTDLGGFKTVLQNAIVPLLESVDNEDQKNAIKNFWDEYCINYLIKLASIDNLIKRGEVNAPALSNDVLAETDKVLKAGDKLEHNLNDPKLIKKIKDIFRISGAPFGLQSQFVRHAFEKPGGYAGDYEVLEFIYNNKPTSEGFGYCADCTFLADDYAKAVRNRKDTMKKKLKAILAGNPKSCKILNIACGASRDLRELFAESTFNLSGKTTFTLIDKSKEALAFSKEKLKDHPDGTEFVFYAHSVYDYLKKPIKYNELLSGQDVVYSIGLADYIPEDALRKQILFFFDLINPGGQLIIAHKDSKNYHPLLPDWWADWTFYLRDMDEVINIVKTSGISDYALTVEQEDDTNIVFFIIITKNKTR